MTFDLHEIVSIARRLAHLLADEIRALVGRMQSVSID
jgi:hypothetical protein